MFSLVTKITAGPLMMNPIWKRQAISVIIVMPYVTMMVTEIF
jgi:hypothetical protein